MLVDGRNAPANRDQACSAKGPLPLALLSQNAMSPPSNCTKEDETIADAQTLPLSLWVLRRVPAGAAKAILPVHATPAHHSIPGCGWAPNRHERCPA